MPPPGSTHEGGTSTSAVATAQSCPSDSAPIVSPPPLPQDILFPDLSFRRYIVPPIPLPAEALSFLGGHAEDEVPSFPYFLCILYF